MYHVSQGREDTLIFVGFFPLLASSLSVLEEMSVPQVFFAGASKSNKVPSRISWLSKFKLCRESGKLQQSQPCHTQ